MVDQEKEQRGDKRQKWSDERRRPPSKKKKSEGLSNQGPPYRVVKIGEQTEDKKKETFPRGRSDHREERKDSTIPNENGELF